MKRIIFILSNTFCILFIMAMFFNSISGQKELIGEEAPLFTLKSVNGDEISLKNFRGKIVLLDFFATWCGPCRMEMYHLKKIYNEYKEKNFAIISIDLYENPEKVKEFINEIGIEWIITIDKDGQVADKYHIQAIPTLILIDPNGIVVDVYTGVTDENVLKDKIENLMLIKTTKITNITYSIVSTHYITTTKSEVQTLITYKTVFSTITEYIVTTKTYTILEKINIQWIIWSVVIIFIITITIFLKRHKSVSV